MRKAMKTAMAAKRVTFQVTASPKSMVSLLDISQMQVN